MRNRLRIAALALSMAGIFAGATAGPVSASTESTTTSDVSASARIYWRILGQHGDDQPQCLTRYSSGAIRMDDCDYGATADAQHWHWINSSWSTGRRLLANRWLDDGASRCLVATYPEVSSGACHDWTSRHWRLIVDDGAPYWNDSLRSESEGLYLDATWQDYKVTLTSVFDDDRGIDWAMEVVS